MRKGWVGAAALLALLAVPAASAHAYLEPNLTSPGPDTHVDVSPTRIHLAFTENIEHEYTHAWVLDNESRRVDLPPSEFPSDQPNVMEVPVAVLADGLYTVQWWTLSVDTHTASGSYLFAVGNASLVGSSGPIAAHNHAAAGPIPAWAEPVANILLFGGITLAVGLPFFVRVVQRGVTLPAHQVRRLSILGMTAATAGVLGGLVRIQALAFTISGPFTRAVTSTKTGLPLAAETAGLLAATVLLWWIYDRTLNSKPAGNTWLWTAAAGGVALLGMSLASHASALLSDRNLALLVDALHLLAASAWIGAIVGFVVTLPGRAVEETAALVRRFSPWGMASVALLVATGTYASVRHLNDWSDLWNSSYGQYILVKMVVLLGLVGLGAFNQRRVGPALDSGVDRRRTLRRSVAIEAVFLAAVLCVTGLLTTSAPPEVVAASTAPQPLLSHVLRTVHVLAYVEPEPVHLGIQTFTVELHPLRAAENGPGATVYLQFQAPGAAPSEDLVAMHRSSDTRWTLTGGKLTERGEWTVHVVVQTPDEYATPSFNVTVD